MILQVINSRPRRPQTSAKAADPAKLNSHNWHYLAVVKIPLKFLDPDRDPGSAPKSNGLLLVRHRTAQSII